MKDPLIFAHGARQAGYDPKLFTHARQVNEKILDKLGDDVLAHLKTLPQKQKPKIYILGFAFKGTPPTSDLRGSTSVALLKRLQKEGHETIYGYDPVVPKEEMEALGVRVVKNVADGFAHADAVIVMNNHSDLRELPMRCFMEKAHIGAALFDTWALYNKEDVSKTKGIVYRRL